MYITHLQNRFIPTFKLKDITRIKKIEIITIMDNLKRLDSQAGPLAKSTKINILAAIQSVFDYAIYLKIITDNPTEGILINRDERDHIKKFQPYSTNEIQEIVVLLQKEPLFTQGIVLTALITGARQGEIAALQTKHLNKKDSTITFEQTAIRVKGKSVVVQPFTKTHENKVVHVPHFLIDLLLEIVQRVTDKNNRFNQTSGIVINLRDKDAFIFEGKRPDQPVNGLVLYRRWKSFVRRNNLRYVRFHDLRHTSASWLLSETKDLKAVQERLGHKDYLTTANFYGHLLEETDKKSSDAFEKLIFSATKPATKD